MSTPRGDPFACADLQEKIELLLEELVVIREVVPEQRERLGERAAAGHDLRATVRDKVERGEALKHPDGIVGAENADGARQADARRPRGRGGKDNCGGGNSELAAVVLAQAVHVETHLVCELDLVEKPPHALVGADGRSEERRVGKGWRAWWSE